MSISRSGRCIAVGVVAVVAVCGVALAQDGTARACIGINDPVTRLACYDRAVSREVQLLPDAARAAAWAPTGPSGASSAAVSDATFGLRVISRVPTEATGLVSRIVGPFDGWQAGTRLSLANGQVWTIADGSSSGYPLSSNPQIRVQQGAFGGYFIEIEGVSHSPRVRRLR